MANIPEMVKITLDTSKLEDKDPQTQALLGTYRAVLKGLDRDLSSFEKALQSATNSFDFFNHNLKRIDEASGLAQQSFYIRKDELENALASLQKQSSALGRDYNISIEDTELITGKRKLHGRRAQSKAVEEVKALGGTATVNPTNPEYMDISIPVDKSIAQGMSARDKSKFITGSIPVASKISSAEQKRIHEREAEKEEKEEKADKREKRKKTLAVLSTITTILTKIADITRRILTATLDRAQESLTSGREARDVGMTSLQKRNYDIFDIAHGLPKGTTFNAIQSTQGKFGDVTKLDTGALEVLARVMGNSVKDMVQSGLGGTNPDKLLDSILNSYFENYLAGKDSLGNKVGREQARRNLVTSLRSVDPGYAELLSTMIDDYTSGYYGNFTDVVGWRGAQYNRTSLTEIERKAQEEVGRKYNEILAIVEDLKDSFFNRLANSMSDLLSKIKSLQIGETATTKLETDIKNRQKNTEYLERMEEETDRLNDMISSEDIAKAGKGIKVGRAGFKYTPEILAGIATGLYDKKYFEENWSKDSGMISAKEAGDYVKRGDEIAQKLFWNLPTQAPLVKLASMLPLMEAVRTENARASGVEDLGYTQTYVDWLTLENLKVRMKDKLNDRKGFASEKENLKNLLETEWKDEAMDAFIEYLNLSGDFDKYGIGEPRDKHIKDYAEKHFLNWTSRLAGVGIGKGEFDYDSALVKKLLYKYFYDPSVDNYSQFAKDFNGSIDVNITTEGSNGKKATTTGQLNNDNGYNSGMSLTIDANGALIESSTAQ